MEPISRSASDSLCNRAQVRESLHLDREFSRESEVIITKPDHQCPEMA